MGKRYQACLQHRKNKGTWSKTHKRLKERLASLLSFPHQIQTSGQHKTQTCRHVHPDWRDAMFGKCKQPCTVHSQSALCCVGAIHWSKSNSINGNCSFTRNRFFRHSQMRGSTVENCCLFFKSHQFWKTHDSYLSCARGWACSWRH